MFDGVILIAEGNRHSNAQGVRDGEFIALEAPNTPTTRFRIASLSKQFTNAAVGILIDQGAISLNSRLSEFFPEYPRAAEITIHHLIEHKSGRFHIPNNLDELTHKTRITLDEMVTLLASKNRSTSTRARARATVTAGYDPSRRSRRTRFRAILRRFPCGRDLRAAGNRQRRSTSRLRSYPRDGDRVSPRRGNRAGVGLARFLSGKTFASEEERFYASADDVYKTVFEQRFQRETGIGQCGRCSVLG